MHRAGVVCRCTLKPKSAATRPRSHNRFHTLYVYAYMYMLLRDEKEERKKQARSNKQTRQSNTAHPRQSLFLEKMSCLRWDSNPRHSIL